MSSAVQRDSWWGWRGGATAVAEDKLHETEGERSILALPDIERVHVQMLYNDVAPEWHGARKPAWARVRKFIEACPVGSLVCDAGCGDGKNLPPCGRAASTAPGGQGWGSGSVLGEGRVGIGSDNSMSLVRICQHRGLESLAADALALPYRSGCFDACLSIAVLHHISTVPRRRRLVSECLRVVRVGGRALLCAWAREQRGRPGQALPPRETARTFGAADVLVPFQPERRGGADSAVAAPHRQQRYCHVYDEGEVPGLVRSLAGAEGGAPWAVVDEQYYEEGHWCVVVRKVASGPLPGSAPE